MRANEPQIQNFVKAVREKYGELLEIGYEYDTISSLFYIWHTNKQLEYEDESFQESIGQMEEEILIAHDVIDYCFSYDFKKDSLYNTAQLITQNVKIGYIDISKTKDFLEKYVLREKASTNKLVNNCANTNEWWLAA